MENNVTTIERVPLARLGEALEEIGSRLPRMLC